MSDLVDVIWRGGFDAWTQYGQARPGEQLPVRIPREQAETSDHFEITKRKRGKDNAPDDTSQDAGHTDNTEVSA